MTEMERRDAEIDGLLRQSMAAPVPTLTADFDGHTVEEIRRRSQAFDGYRRRLFIGYGIVSVVASIVGMRGQGLDWATIFVAVISALAIGAATPWIAKAASVTTQDSRPVVR